MEEKSQGFTYCSEKIPSRTFYCRSSPFSSDQKLSFSCFITNPQYGCLMHADGHGEVWTDWNEMSKFFQYGWRCTTNENSYSNPTLMGNWNQERYSLEKIVQPQPLPSKFGHYFETTFGASYRKKLPPSQSRFKKEPHCFPGHQTELIPPPYKASATGRTDYMINYSGPQANKGLGYLCDPTDELS
ncbi:cilia- and flagella-associated protein 68 isoform X1 [Monodelphis domestica]|uniref:cilia- and flagella-associated protein 68 isoform X1 n=1 Tax=Monodelphis domestica TaxID=13616 RepID=UPI0024E252C5|nr:cilia- and flagella-associated protein 68 isoform X1 [Monodelphis domestica]